MARTKLALVEDALRKLGVLDALHTASAVDSALAEARYDDRLAELKDKGLAYWPNTGRDVSEIPNVVFGPMVNILSEDLAAYYGTTPPTVTDDSGRAVSCGTKGMRDLRRHMAKGPSGEPTYATYY